MDDPRAKLLEALMAGPPRQNPTHLDDIIPLMQAHGVTFGGRESANVEDRRDWANDHWLLKANDRLASGAADIFGGLQDFSRKFDPPVSMSEIGDLLPSNRLGGFATMRRP